MPNIDFTSAYRDATKGSTLKALAARRAEMQAAMATARPQEVKSPEQAIASVADTISGSIREGRLADQEAKGRARFAQLLAGGLTPDEAGEAYGLDAETTQKWMDRNWAQEDAKVTAAAREAELLRSHGWDVEKQTAEVRARKDAAATLERAQITLADHNATIEERQHAREVVDNAKVAATAVTTGRETSDIDRTAEADIASKKAAQDAAMADPAAKVKLAIEGGFLTPEEGKSRIDAINAEAAKKAMSPGLEEQNKKFAVDALEWKQQGAANVRTQVAQTHKALQLLEQTKDNWIDKPGYGMGLAEQLPEWGQAVIGLSSSDTVKARDAIQGAVQQSLKAVLGTQFAAVEGEQLMKRAFSTTMDPAENIKRARLIMDNIQQIAAKKQAMVDYFDNNNGSLAGYTGPALDTSALEMLEFGDGDTTAPADTETPDISTMSQEELERIARQRGP